MGVLARRRGQTPWMSPAFRACQIFSECRPRGSGWHLACLTSQFDDGTLSLNRFEEVKGGVAGQDKPPFEKSAGHNQRRTQPTPDTTNAGHNQRESSGMIPETDPFPMTREVSFA